MSGNPFDDFASEMRAAIPASSGPSNNSMPEAAPSAAPAATTKPMVMNSFPPSPAPAYPAPSRDYLHEFYQVTVGSTELSGNKDVTQIIEVCSDYDKYKSLLNHLRMNLNDRDRVLVFVETKRGCDMLTRSLRDDKFQARAMHGDKSQEERDFVLKEFRNRQATLLVATDVAARGLDIDDIRMVINFDFPNDIENYVHR
jgi:ATP-dependent RNA helicase DDX5/DBP2